jgi:hypothetical protein
MTTLQKITLLIILFTGAVSMAQNQNIESTNNPNRNDVGYLMSQIDFMTSNKTAKPSASSLHNISSNNVYIAQIGMNNMARVISSSEISDIKVMQYGDDNQAYFQAAASTIETSLVQNGNNHGIYYSNPFYIDSHKSQITQQGNGQNIEWYGGNAISEKMEVSMQGTSQSIIIRNYN